MGLSDVSIIAEELDGIVLVIGVSYVNRKMPKESVSSKDQNDWAGNECLHIVAAPTT